MGQKAQIGGVRGPVERGGTKMGDWRSKWEGAVQRHLAEQRNGFCQESGDRVDTRIG